MKRITAVLMLLGASLVSTVGCRSNPTHPSKVDVFHVSSVNPDAPIDVIGSLNGKQYSLSVSRDKVPLYVAYYEPIGTGDVGKEFHAIAKDGSLFIDVPDKGTVRYEVKAVSEVSRP